MVAKYTQTAFAWIEGCPTRHARKSDAEFLNTAITCDGTGVYGCDQKTKLSLRSGSI